MRRANFVTFLLSLRGRNDCNILELLAHLGYGLVFALIALALFPTAFLSVIVLIMTAYCGSMLWFANKLNSVSTVKLLPITYRRRSVYILLLAGFAAVCMVVLATVSIFAVDFLVPFIVLAASAPDQPFPLEGFGLGFDTLFSDGYSVATFAGIAVYAFSAGVIFSNINKRWLRHTVNAAMLAIAALLVLTIPVIWLGGGNGWGDLQISLLGCPLAVAVISCSVAAVALIAAVITVFRSEKPKNY